MDTYPMDKFRPKLHVRGKNAHDAQKVCIKNVTFGKGDDWMIKYAEVYSVHYKTIGEMIFKGTLDECHEFIKKYGHELTSTPTTPTMPISRYVPPRRNNPK